jgi:hypothetical protein
VVRVGVRLPSAISDVGEYLADVTALEAAGADAIWLDDTGLEPWIVLGAMAAVTHRVGLGCLLTTMSEQSSSRLGACATALQSLSRGRTMVGVPPHGMPNDHLAVLRAAGARLFVFDAEGARETEGGSEVWDTVPIPPDRDAWTSTLSACEAAGAAGVIVPWNARLIDLLRNTEPDDRSDLLVSTG